MIGIIIATILKDKKELEILIESIEKCTSFYDCLIINQNFEINLDINKKNIKTINVNFKNNSEAKNLGIDFFKNKSQIKYIWFLDDDCYITEINLIKLYNKIINYKNIPYNIFILQIINYENKNVGVNLYNLGLLNFLYLFRIGGPSFIIKKKKINYKFNKILGPGTQLRSSEDIDFHLSNFNFRVKFIKNLNIYHPTEVINEYKIIRYSFGQGVMFKNLNLIKKIVFLILSYSRPVIGYIYYYIFNSKLKNMYKKRIYAFIRGYKKY